MTSSHDTPTTELSAFSSGKTMHNSGSSDGREAAPALTVISATGDRVRMHRGLRHQPAVVERVLPLGAPPFSGSVPADCAHPKHRNEAGRLLDQLGPSGRVSLHGNSDREVRIPGVEPRQPRRESERASWMRYLMNVHLMWVD